MGNLTSAIKNLYMNIVYTIVVVYQNISEIVFYSLFHVLFVLSILMLTFYKDEKSELFCLETLK